MGRHVASLGHIILTPSQHVSVLIPYCCELSEEEDRRTRANHFYDHVISLKPEIWSHNTSLSPPLFIEVPVAVCVLGTSMFYVFAIGVLKPIRP